MRRWGYRRQESRRLEGRRRFVVSPMAVACIAVVATGMFPTTSAASLEKVGVIGAKVLVDPEAIAVDDSTSDIYVADGPGNRIVRFDQEGNFLEEWGWGVGDGARKFERCGPAGEPAFPTCSTHNGLEGSGGVGELESPNGVAVDQATGDVYVSDSNPSARIQFFTANGEPVGTGVAQQGEGEGEVSLEGGQYGPSIAVDNKGDVYFVNQGKTFGPRVMEFKPRNSKFTENGEYEFERSLFVGGFSEDAGQLAVDEAGNIYMAKGAHPIYKFASSELAKPACEETKTPEVEGMAVDPVSEHIYFYEQKFHKVVVLGTDCEALETFESGTGVEQEDARSGAFSPDGAWQGRSKGILYLGTESGLKHPHPAEIFAFAGPESAQLAPVIESSWPKSVGQAFARLEAVVQPNGDDTSVKFEYGDAGPCSSAACSEMPVGGLDIGSEAKPQTVGITVEGLAPNTTYHFRVVASSTAGTVKGPDETFKTFAVGSPRLPDDRAYELVTPVEKDGGEVFPLDPVAANCKCEPGAVNLSMPMQSTETSSGEPEVVFEGYPFAANGEAVDENEYRATRSPTGWLTEDLSPELASRGGRGFRGFTPDLLTGVFEQGEPALSPQAIGEGYLDLYQRTADGSFTPLLTMKPPHRPAFNPSTGSEQFSPEYDGQSPDGTRIFFTANDALTGATAFAPAAQDGGASKNNLYEWAEGKLSLVNVLPGNTKTTPGAALGSGKELGVTESGLDTTNAIVDGGRDVFWSTEADGKVYERIDGESTIAVPDSGHFLAASASGDKVLLSDGHIYDLTTKVTTDITEGNGGFQGILGASEDLSHIYFVDTAVLTLPSEKNAYGAAAKAGEDNLYFYDSETEEIRYIATLSGTDNQTGEGDVTGDWEASPTDRLAQVTPDGRFVAFESHAELTGYDNEVLSGQCETRSNAPHSECFEVFEYDSLTDSLVCVSCNPTGVRPVGRSVLSLIGAIGSRFPQPRNLLSDGRLFFDSADVLSPSDSQPGVENVYEFEKAGQGTCEASAGCVGLISSGHSRYGAQFFGATSSGRDAFFTTREQVVPEDRDELVDLYDAREGGGITFLEAPSPCAGEGCRATSGEGAEWSAPASALLTVSPFAAPLVMPTVTHAAVIPESLSCPRRTERRHGRCVKAKEGVHHRHAGKKFHRRDDQATRGVRR